MVGVVHSSSAIDAIQRFIGRIELGMLPSIIDTIIFIEGGDISNVLIIKMTVKVPSGLRDRDLARPVVEVRNYKTRQLEYEIYSFGQDIVITPIKSGRSSDKPTQYRELTKYGRTKPKKEKIHLEIEVVRDKIILKAAPEHASQNIVILSNNNEIFTGSLSRKSEINLSLSNKEGRKILKEFDRNRDIYARIK